MIAHTEAHPTIQLADLRDDRHHLVHGIVAQVMRRRVRRPAAGGDLQLDASLVTTIDLHLGRLADDDEIGLDLRINFNEGVGRNTVTPFFHVAEVVGGVAIEQAQVARNRQAIDHAGRADSFHHMRRAHTECHLRPCP